jgi:hypothetical protein
MIGILRKKLKNQIVHDIIYFMFDLIILITKYIGKKF